MKFRNHAVIGIIAGTALTPFLGLFAVPATFIGSIYPDIDIKSKSSRILYLLFFVVAGVLWFLNYTSISLAVLVFSLLPQLTSHRGFFHSITASILISAVIAGVSFMILKAVSIPLVVCFFIGYILHLLADKCLKII